MNRARRGGSGPHGGGLVVSCARAMSAAAVALLPLLGTPGLPFARAESPRADAALEARARELFKQGNRLIEQARYVDALEKFEAAYATWQNPKIQLNIATTLRTLGRHAEAARHLRRDRAHWLALSANARAGAAEARVEVAAGRYAREIVGATAPAVG